MTAYQIYRRVSRYSAIARRSGLPRLAREYWLARAAFGLHAYDRAIAKAHEGLR